jgi:beta-phosphoglucomutase-like phosphatase (HAD superfamily)
VRWIGFSPATRDAIIAALGWAPLVDLVLSPADAGRGRPWPDMPLTALLRLGGGSVDFHRGCGLRCAQRRCALWQICALRPVTCA